MKKDLYIETFGDGSIRLHLLSEDAREWADDNFPPSTVSPVELSADEAGPALDSAIEACLTIEREKP